MRSVRTARRGRRSGTDRAAGGGHDHDRPALLDVFGLLRAPAGLRAPSGTRAATLTRTVLRRDGAFRRPRVAVGGPAGAARQVWT
jgi:hypothetical protein